MTKRMFMMGQLPVKFGSLLQHWFPFNIRGGLVDFVSIHDKKLKFGLGLQGRRPFSGHKSGKLGKKVMEQINSSKEERQFNLI